MKRSENPESDENPAFPGASELLSQVGGQRLIAQTDLQPEQALEALWDGEWWPARVIEALDDGRVSIRYPGWDPSHDETVPRERLRLPAAKFKTIQITGRGFAQSGLLVAETGEFLVLETPSGNKIFVSKAQILSFEVAD